MVLKEQINTYSEKFKELQETLTKSNEVFTSFKKDSDKMQVGERNTLLMTVTSK